MNVNGVSTNPYAQYTGGPTGQNAPSQEIELMPVADAAAGGDVGAEIAALVTLNAHEQRKGAKALRQSEENMARAAEDKEVAEIHNQGNLALAKGIVEGSIQILEGTLSVLGIGQAQGTAGAAASSGASGAGPAKASGADVANKFIGGAGTIIGGAFDKAISDAKADEKAAEYDAKHHTSAAEDAKDEAADAKRLLEQARDFYKEWTQSKASAAQAALHRS